MTFISEPQIRKRQNILIQTKALFIHYYFIYIHERKISTRLKIILNYRYIWKAKVILFYFPLGLWNLIHLKGLMNDFSNYFREILQWVSHQMFSK